LKTIQAEDKSWRTLAWAWEIRTLRMSREPARRVNTPPKARVARELRRSFLLREDRKFFISR
jgi:hypothetical protein